MNLQPVIACDLDAIPVLLRQYPQWVVWKLLPSNKEGEKPRKVPYNPRTGESAKAGVPETWGTYEEAVAAYQRGGYAGIGFEFHSSDPFIGGDIDNCRAPNSGEITSSAWEYIQKANTYTEVSPSGTGVKFVAVGKKKDDRCKRGDFEMYDGDRFFTLTGHHLNGTPTTIEERQDAFSEMYDAWFSDPPAATNRIHASASLPKAGSLTDAQILDLAKRAANGDKFVRLWNGDQAEYKGDESAGDLALCSLLAFYAGPEGHAQIDRLFQQSRRMRPKWNSRHRGDGTTYGQMTIECALSSKTDFYLPQKSYVEYVEIPQKVNSTYSTYDFLPSKKAEAWEPIVPFPVYNVPPFPADALPEWARDFVLAKAATTETPPDLAGVLVLTIAGLAIGKSTNVRAGSDWFEPLNLYTVVVMPPGSRKSPVFSACTRPLEAYERDMRAALEPELAEAQAEYDILARRLEEAKKRAAKMQKYDEKITAESEVKDLAQKLLEFKLPVLPRLITKDCTPEKLNGLLKEQQGRIGVLSPEGDVFDMIAGRYSEKGSILSPYLEGHSGDTLYIDRVNRAQEIIYSPALTIGLTVQPEVLRGLAAKQGFRGRGLLARFLYALPENRLGFRLLQDKPMPEEIQAAYHNGLRALLALTPRSEENDLITPFTLRFDSEANHLFQQFRKEVEAKLRPGEELGEMTDWGAKFNGAVARIAGILHLAEYGRHSMEISGRVMQNALRLASYFLAHVKAAMGEMGADEDLERAQKLLAWIQRKQITHFKKSEAFNALRSTFPKVTDMERPLNHLCDRWFIKPLLQQRRDGPGQPASQIFIVNPAILDTQNTQNSAVTLTASLLEQAKAHETTAGRQRGKHLAAASASIGSPEADYEGTYFGTLAEILVYRWLEDNGQKPAYVLLDTRAVTKPDLTLNNVTYEIKACPPTKEFLSLSERQHRDPLRRADYYLPVVFISDTTVRVCAPISYDAIDQWELATGGHEPCHRQHRDLLLPLRSLEELVTASQDTEQSKNCQTMEPDFTLSEEPKSTMTVWTEGDKEVAEW